MELYRTLVTHVILDIFHAVYCTVRVLHWYSSRDKCLYCTTLLHHVLYLWLYLTLLRYLMMVLLCLYVLERGWGRMSYSSIRG